MRLSLESNHSRWSLRCQIGGGSTETPLRRGVQVRPGSKNRAKAHWGSLGTWEDRPCPWNNSPGWGASGRTTPGCHGPMSARGGAKAKASSKVGRRNAPNGVPSEKRGRLSGFIVPSEIRRTDRGSLGIGKGATERQAQSWETGPVLRDRRLVPGTALDNSGVKLSFEEPYA